MSIAMAHEFFSKSKQFSVETEFCEFWAKFYTGIVRNM